MTWTKEFSVHRMRTALLVLIGILIGVLIALPFRSRDDASPPQLATGDSLAERELDRVVAAVELRECRSTAR